MTAASGGIEGALAGRRVLLIVSGGIAAYKALELIRLLRGQECGVTCVLTRAGGEFVTPLLPAKYGDASGVRGAAWLWPLRG